MRGERREARGERRDARGSESRTRKGVKCLGWQTIPADIRGDTDSERGRQLSFGIATAATRRNPVKKCVALRGGGSSRREEDGLLARSARRKPR